MPLGKASNEVKGIVWLMPFQVNRWPPADDPARHYGLSSSASKALRVHAKKQRAKSATSVVSYFAITTVCLIYGTADGKPSRRISRK
jgi:hypothetical protein